MRARPDTAPHKNVTVWLPTALVDQIDRHLAQAIAAAGIPGARVTRHAWIAQAVASALATAQAGAES